MATIQALAPFTPLSISGCRMWLDASDAASVILSGGSVTQWNDKSGNGVNATLGVGPSYANRGIVFDGSTQYLRTTLNATSVATSQFLVFRYTYSGSPMVLMGANGINALLFQFNGATTISTGDWSTAGYSNTDLLSGSLNILAQTSNTTSVNGNTPTSGALSINAGGATFTIGAGYTDNRQKFNGTIYEIISYNSVLSTSQRQQVEGYLAWKWGGVGNLPAGHPFKLIAPNTQGLSLPTALRSAAPTQAFRAGGAIGYDPTSVGTCRVWLDGADSSTVVLSNTTVTTWVDKSGNNNSFTIQSGGPTYSSNGVLFNRSNSDVLISANSIPFATTTSYIFYVAQTSNFGNILVDAVAFPTTSISIRYANGILNGTPTSAGDGNDFANGNYYVNGTFNPGLTASTYLSNHLITAVDSTLNGTYRVTLSDTFLSRYFGGTFYEVLIYTGGLTSTQRQQIEGYLAWKWGLQGLLPSTHLYKTINPGFTFATPLPSIRALQQTNFNPARFAGIQIWLDGTDPLATGMAPANGTPILTWVDKSGSGNSLASVGTPAPTYVSATSNISYDGSSYYIKTGLSIPLLTFFAVARKTSANAPLYTNTQLQGNTGFFPNFNGSYYLAASDSVWLTSTSPFSDGTTYMYSINYSSTSNINLWTNGSIQATVSGLQTGSITRDRILLGCRNFNGPEVWVGTFSEVIQYNTSLTTSQRQSIEGYLAWKWNMVGSLPATHPYKKFPPAPN